MGTYVTARPTKYCHACGAVIDGLTAQCPHCGIMQPTPYALTMTEKRIAPAFALALVLGVFGAHRFYAGRWLTGILMLCTLGGFGIWALIDMVMIVTGTFKDAEGNRLTEWT
jgi:TM2 domain-containing membrane protein YozV